MGEKKIWTSKDLQFLGYWLLQKGETGYGLLCIISPALGVKIGTLLKLKWKDFIDPITDKSYFDLYFDDNRHRILNDTIQRNITSEFAKLGAHGMLLNEFVFKNMRTNKVLSTSTLNRELEKKQQEFEDDIFQKSGVALNLRELKSNAFEIAWGLDMVKFYHYTKKAFITVSKHLGHRQLKDTFQLLEMDVIEPEYEIYRPHYDLNNLPIKEEILMEEVLTEKKKMFPYLYDKGYIKPTLEPFINKES